MFNANRLAFARKRRGLTKKSLADAVGVTPRSISMFENNELEPSDSTLELIAKALTFPISFFSQEDDIETLDEHSVSFRALSKMSASRKHSALSSGACAIAFNKWVEERFELPPHNLPDMERDLDPEFAAISLRQFWELGELPIGNLIHLLEANGIRVFSLAEDTADVDAFSLWKDNTPFIFLNTLKSAERSRFDAAHELGHLVLHKHASPSGTEIEREADRFASAFLMPASSVKASVNSIETIPSLIKAKKKWRVSLAALAYRMHKLGILSDWHYRTLCIEMSKLGFTKNEPESIPREQSKIWAMIFTSLREEGVTKEDIAKDLDIYPSEVDTFVFGLILTEVTSNKLYKTNLSNSKRGHLKIIK